MYTNTYPLVRLRGRGPAPNAPSPRRPITDRAREMPSLGSGRIINMMDAEGMVHVPRDRPGIGVTVDTDFIRALTVRSQVLTAGGRVVGVE